MSGSTENLRGRDPELIEAIKDQLSTHQSLDPKELAEELERAGVRVDTRVLRMTLVEEAEFISQADRTWRLARPDDGERPPAASQTTPQADSSDFAVSSPSLDTERELRRRLQGCRLIAEIGLEQDTIAAAEQAVAREARGRPADALVAICPAALATYLVGHGVYNYDREYWPTLTVTGPGPSDWGRAFERAIRTLDLETFEDMVLGEGALRYVAPILAHGGIPSNSLDGYFTLLRRHVSHVDDASDLLALWRTRRAPFAGVHKPVRRFLLYGGDLAVDLIDRSLDLFREFTRSGTTPSAQSVGLPGYIVEAFDRHVRGQPPITVETRRRSKAPRPWIELDPWSASGLTLVLPAIPSSIEATSWRLQSDDHFERFEASHLRDREVALRPARGWSISLMNGHDVTAEVTFEGLDELPALFFDPGNQALIRPAGGIRLDTAWVLMPGEVALTSVEPDGSRSPARIVEELPTQTGPWSGFSFVAVGLDGLRSLELTRPGEQSGRRILVRSPAEKPRLTTEAVTRAHSANGLPILVTRPELHLPGGHWVVRVSVDGEAQAPLEIEVAESETFPLELPAGVHSIDLDVRGPLGADLRTQFALCAGLKLERPSGLIDGSRDDSVVVGGPGLSVDGQPSGHITRLAIPPDGDEVRCSITDVAGRATEVVARVRKVLWALEQPGQHGVSFGNSPVEIDEADLTGSSPTGLLVRTGQPDLGLKLQLSTGGEVLQATDEVRTRGEDGRWMFDLGRFADTVRSASTAELTFELWVGPRPMTVARVRRGLEVLALDGQARRDGGDWALDLTFSLSRVLTDRVVRLWPLTRPWEEPIEAPVPDDHLDHVTITDEPRLEAGLHIVEIVVDSGWVSAPRQRPHRDVSLVPVGDRGDFHARIDTITAESDALARLERALVTGGFEGELTNDDWQRVGVAALEAAAAIASGALPRHGTETRGFHALSWLLSANPVWLARVAARAVEQDRVNPSQLLALGIEMSASMSRSRHRPESVPESEMRVLWAVAPSLAAPLDFSHLGQPEVDARIEEFTGWDPTTGQPPPFGEPLTQLHVAIGVDQLQAILRAADLLPKQILTLDALVAGHFEWLIAEKSGSHPSPSSWWNEHKHLMNAPIDIGNLASEALAARVPDRGTGSLAWLPRLSLFAALAAVTGAETASHAKAALKQAVLFSPRLVRRDLVLAHALTSLENRQEPR
jgi:hypothetical protein